MHLFEGASLLGVHSRSAWPITDARHAGEIYVGGVIQTSIRSVTVFLQFDWPRQSNGNPHTDHAPYDRPSREDLGAERKQKNAESFGGNDRRRERRNEHRGGHASQAPYEKANDRRNESKDCVQ